MSNGPTKNQPKGRLEAAVNLVAWVVIDVALIGLCYRNTWSPDWLNSAIGLTSIIHLAMRGWTKLTDVIVAFTGNKIGELSESSDSKALPISGIGLVFLGAMQTVLVCFLYAFGYQYFWPLKSQGEVFGVVSYILLLVIARFIASFVSALEKATEDGGTQPTTNNVPTYDPRDGIADCMNKIGEGD